MKRSNCSSGMVRPGDLAPAGYAPAQGSAVLEPEGLEVALKEGIVGPA